MRMILWCLWLSAGLFAQDASKPQAGEEKPEKPSPKEKARELLDRAAKSVTAAQPEVQVAGLLHLGENYALFDAKKAVEFLEQAFAAAAALPDAQRGELQSVVVATAAEVNLEKAVEMVTQMGPPPSAQRDVRVRPVERIVARLVDKKELDRAIQVIETVGVSGQFPFRAAMQVFEKLSPDDARRVQLFGSATSAYAGRPYGPFGDFLARHWQDVPPQMANDAVRALVNSILDRTDDQPMFKTLSTSKGSVSLGSQQDAELFNLLHIVRAFEAKRADEILEKRPELKAALERFPKGAESMRGGADDNMSTSVTSGQKASAEQRARMQLDALASSRSAEAQAAMKEDPRKALEIAKTIPLEYAKAQTLGSIARGVGDKDPAMARSVLNDCVRTLEGMKEIEMRIGTWDIVAEAYHKIKEPERAWEAIDKGMADAAELYKKDADADTPNKALREYWPSTQYYRMNVYRAANLFGVDAEPLLGKIADPDLNLLASIDLAQALLGRPRRGMNINVNREPKK
ncbi:MAG: hypothetical protein HYR60_20950 [Acidobacteria bacterium]|nr:hypothetical protein [Acidobacteriota bacterium]